MKTKILSLTVAAGLLLVPATASATDADVQKAITDAAQTLGTAEQKSVKASEAFADKPTQKTAKKLRSAIKSERKVLDQIVEDLKAPQADSPQVTEGRDQIVEGLEKIDSAYGSLDKALAKATKGKEKAAKKSISKANKQIDAGNALIEEGEKKAGAELTPNTDS